MSSKAKVKGTAYERELVKQFQKAGYEAKRAWGSNGQAMGQHEEVDVIVYKTEYPDMSGFGPIMEHCLLDAQTRPILRIQAKRRKKIPAFLGLTDKVNAAIFRQDNDESYIMMRLSDFIEGFLNE